MANLQKVEEINPFLIFKILIQNNIDINYIFNEMGHFEQILILDSIFDKQKLDFEKYRKSCFLTIVPYLPKNERDIYKFMPFSWDDERFKNINKPTKKDFEKSLEIIQKAIDQKLLKNVVI